MPQGSGKSESLADGLSSVAWMARFSSAARIDRSIRILDVGCGYGDVLRRIERWAKSHDVSVELTGIDLNRDAVVIAGEASNAASQIEWVNADVFEYSSREPIDLVVSALFTHHLAEADIVRFLKWMEQRATMGWFINDLSRNAVPYHLFRAFSKLMGLHPFVQHDGPASIARAFCLKIGAGCALRRGWPKTTS